MSLLTREQLVRFTIEEVRAADDWSEVDVLRATKAIDVVLRHLTENGLDLDGPFVLAVVREEVAGVDA